MDNPICFLLDAPQGDADVSWVQVAKVGTFSDPRYGKFKITLSDFQKWITNFHDIALADGRLGLPVDVDHSPEKKGDTEAVGWVKQLEQRDSELWGRVEWNSEGKTLVADRRYAYISPSYSPDFKDESGKSHGTALVGIALTNRPFLQMATVNLSATFAKQVGDDGGLEPEDIMDLSDMCLDVSEPERQAHAVVVKKVDGKTKHMFPVPPGDRLHARLAKAFLPRAVAAGHITEEEAAKVRARADAVLAETGKQHSAYSHRQMDIQEILTTFSLSREDLGVAADADDKTVLTALAAHQAKPAEPAPTAVPAGHVVLSQEAVAKLTADAAAGAQAAVTLRQGRFETAFDTAQREGKVVLAQRESFKAMFDIAGNEDATLTLLGALRPVVSMEPVGVGGAASDLEPAARILAAEYTDTVTAMPVDSDGLKVLAKAGEIQAAQNVPFERALELAQAS